MIVDFFQIPIPTIKSNTLETGKAPPSEAGAGGWEVEEVKQKLTWTKIDLLAHKILRLKWT